MNIHQKLDNIIEYGFYLWLFLLPWQTRYFFYQASLSDQPWEAGSIVIYASEILLLILLGLRFILWSRQSSNSFGNKKFYYSLPIALSLFVLYAFLSSFWSAFPALSVYYSLKLFLALGVFWLASTSNISWWRAGTILIVAGLIQGLLAIDQFLLQIVPANKWLGMALQDGRNLGVSVVDTGFRRWLRAYGGFPHPNILGGYLVVCLSLVLYVINYAEQSWQRRKSKKIQVFESAMLGSLVIIVSGILLSFSRAAWLGAGLLFVLFAGLAIFKKPVILGKTLVLTIVLTIVSTTLWLGLYSAPFITRLEGSERLEVMSTTERLGDIAEGQEMWRQHPWLGVGLGAYSYALQLQNQNSYPWQLQPPHNAFLLILAELGLIGLALWLAVLVVIFIMAGQNHFFMILYTVIIFLMMFDHWWWSLNFGWYLIFMLFALLYTSKKYGEYGKDI